ncbi:MAG: Holliday junction resolvase RuvX [Cyclobacteriaceae bacterium]|nr:Holliday junction resolvase RuvX [Cyclobacteriaceae bacterium]
MGRIVGIDFGSKRVGIAVTDPLKIIASPLETVPANAIIDFLKEYHLKENIEAFALGFPKNTKNMPTHATPLVLAFEKKLQTFFPDIPIYKIDERYTSKMALATMIAGGSKKKDRQNKGNIDKISAAIILQSYLESHDF